MGTTMRMEWVQNGYRKDIEWIWNGNRSQKGKKSILWNANYMRMHSSEHMLTRTAL